MHAKIAIDALRAGKNVLCEKPAARTYEEAMEMQKAQHEFGKVLNIGVVNRFNDGVNRIRDIIAAGELGEVYHVYASFRAHRSIPGLGGRFTTMAASGGGALIDWGVHYLDIVMYCCGDPKPLTASGEAFCKLGRDMRNYAFTDMWAGPPAYDGTYDVDDSVAGLVRTEGPTITLHGAWAQNIGVAEQYIDFMGADGGIRLQYGSGFKIYTAKDGALLETEPSYVSRNMFDTEVNSFIDCAQTGRKSAANIDTVIITSKIMQAIYDSSSAHREVVLD
jgi:predicted dehydrogenase